MDQALWDQTVEVAVSQGVIAAPPDASAFRTDLAEAAADIVEAEWDDVTGTAWEPVEVTLNPGGE